MAQGKWWLDRGNREFENAILMGTQRPIILELIVSELPFYVLEKKSWADWKQPRNILLQEATPSEMS